MHVNYNGIFCYLFYWTCSIPKWSRKIPIYFPFEPVPCKNDDGKFFSQDLWSLELRTCMLPMSYADIVLRICYCLKSLNFLLNSGFVLLVCSWRVYPLYSIYEHWNSSWLQCNSFASTRRGESHQLKITSSFLDW